MATVLELLKKAENGLTQQQLADKANVEGIVDPFVQLGELINDGRARFDKNPEPPRFKATPAAFS